MIATEQGVRCPNPFKGGICGKKLAEYLDGLFITHCPRCKRPVVIDNRIKQ